MASLKDKTISGIFWSFFQKIGGKGLSVIVSIVLARILTPKEFGLIAMLTIFIAISQALTQGGFNQALIQKKNTDEEDFSSVFYINLIVSLGLYFILFFTAPLIAKFYDQPALISLTRVLSFVLIINAFSLVQSTKLKKDMHFKTLAFIHLPSIIVSGAFAIIMALLGYGVWSLVGQQLVMRLVYTIQLWFYSKWTPQWIFNKQKVKKLFAFGGNMMISSMLDQIFKNIYLVVIGKFFPAVTLGYFKNASNLSLMPTRTLSSAIKQVTFPAFSEIQDDNKRLKQGYKKAIQQLFFWVSPLLIIAAVLATPLFRFVLTEKWLPAVPFFQILCIYALFDPVCSFNMDIIKVKGRSDLYLKLGIAVKVIVLILLATSIPFGIYAVVASRPVYVFIKYFINSYYSGKFIDYSSKQQLLDILPVFILNIVIGGFVWILYRYFNFLTDLWVIIAGFSLGIFCYVLIAKTFKLEPYRDFKTIILSKYSGVINKVL